MKSILSILACSMIILFSSCGGTDCTPQDLIGTYTGTNTCAGEEPDTLSFVITEGENGMLVFTDDTGDDFSVQLEGCTFSIPEISFEFFGISITTSGSGEFSGSQLTITQTLTAEGQTEVCTYVGNK